MPSSARISRSVVGLRDIARELDVSVSLVSKVLSGRLGTSGANAAKIRAIREKAVELGYQKNLLAEALRTGRQNVWALYLHRHGEAGSGIVDEMIAGVADEAGRTGQRLSIHYYSTSEEVRDSISRTHRNMVDGVIFAGIPHAELTSDLRKMLHRGLPVITIHDRELDQQLPNVGMDQAAVTYAATSHLIERGCRNIAHFRVEITRTSLPADRFEGYRRALVEHGLRCDPELVIDVPDYSYDTGLSAVIRLVQSGRKFDGLVGQSDQHGIAVINHLSAQAVRVPGQVRVTGVDNAPFCRYSIVPLTSVSQQFRQRGERAAQMLLRRLNGEVVRSELVEPNLVIRASSAG